LVKEYKLTLKVGDKIEVGRFRNVATTIKGIELDEHSQPVIITSKGSKKVLTFRLNKLAKTGKQILQEAKKKKKRKK
tara:strand:- start:499 stop:729 length:231 start_codon:yes stop_codon:yes gene_type:complete